MKPADKASEARWRDLEERMHEKFGLNCATFDAEGNKVTDYVAWGNRLCPVIKGSDAGRSQICAPCNKALMARARDTGEPVIDACDAGLGKICVPLFADGEFLGITGGCGYLPRGEELEFFLMAKSVGRGEDELRELAADVPVWDPAREQELVDWIRAGTRDLLE